MADALKPTIQRVTEESTISNLGEVQRHVQVQYAVGPHGPFFVRVPAAEFSAGKAQEAMKSRVDEINALVNGGSKG